MGQMQELLEAPIVISGAGPVGLSLALGLARRGVRSIVLEKKAKLSEHSKAILISPRSLEILGEWGVLDTFKEHGGWVDELHVTDSVTASELLSFSFATIRSISAGAGACILPQDETERLLYEACIATTLVDIRFGHSVSTFDSDESGVRTRVQTQSGQYVLKSEYLCGCDGAHSSVREGLGFELEGKTYDAHAILADVRIEDDRDNQPWPRTNLRNRNLSFAARFKQGYWRIVFAQRGLKEETPPTPEFVQSKVDELIGKGPAKIIWSSTFKIHCRNAPHFRVGRVLLAGDAAHLNSPAGGQGMNAGIHDAHNLAWKLALAVQGAVPEALLKSYDEERYDAITHGVDIATDRLTKVGILGPVWLRMAIFGLVKWLVRFRRIQRGMALAAGMLNFRYDQSELIDASGGRLLPDVQLGDGLRLRQALGPEGGLIELVQGGWKASLTEATYDLSEEAMRELSKAGGPFLAVRPDHVVAYSGPSREKAESYCAVWLRSSQVSG